MSGPPARLREDVEALASMSRSSSAEGEQAAARWVADRLRAVGAATVEVEPFRFQRSYAAAHATHSLAALLAARLGGRAGATLALAALGSLEAEASGRAQWARRLLPASEGANVVARVPARGRARASLVLVAHHDAAHTGLVWHRALVEAGSRRRLARRRIDPALAPVGAAYALVGAGAAVGGRAGRWARGVGGAVCAAHVALMADVARGATVPGANDNATGVAALVELARRAVADPLPGTELVLLSTGAEEAGMGGMAAFLRDHAPSLRARRAFVLGLDTLGSGTPIVCSAEATLLAHRYRRRDVALVCAGARRAAVPEPEVWRIGTWTDPVLAVHAGLGSASLLSVGPRGVFTRYHRLDDVPEHVDWSCLERCVEIAWGTALLFASLAA